MSYLAFHLLVEHMSLLAAETGELEQSLHQYRCRQRSAWAQPAVEEAFEGLETWELLEEEEQGCL